MMLNELLREEIEEVEQEENRGFMIENLEGCNWAFRKLRAYELKEADIVALAQKETERINNWKDSEIESINRQKEFFKGLIMAYAMDQRAADPKFKISTPYGKATFHKAPAKWNYDDEKIIESLKAAGYTELIRVKEEVNKTDLKKAAAVVNGAVVMADSGEVIEGITVEEQPEIISIKTEA